MHFTELRGRIQARKKQHVALVLISSLLYKEQKNICGLLYDPSSYFKDCFSLSRPQSYPGKYLDPVHFRYQITEEESQNY